MVSVYLDPQELDQAMLQLLPLYQSPQPASIATGYSYSNTDLPQVQPHLVQPLLLSALKDTFTDPALQPQPSCQPQHNALEILSSCTHWFSQTLQMAMHSKQEENPIICDKYFKPYRDLICEWKPLLSCMTERLYCCRTHRQRNTMHAVVFCLIGWQEQAYTQATTSGVPMPSLLH